MLNILYFSGGYHFFQISPGKESLYNRCRKLIYLLAGETWFGTGKQFQQIYWPGKSPGHISPGHLDRVLQWNYSANTSSLYSPVYIYFYHKCMYSFIYCSPIFIFLCLSLVSKNRKLKQNNNEEAKLRKQSPKSLKPHHFLEQF